VLKVKNKFPVSRVKWIYAIQYSVGDCLVGTINRLFMEEESGLFRGGRPG
jgi:hypothetical protein